MGIVRVKVILSGNFPGGILPGGSFPVTQVRNTKFGKGVFNKMFLNAAECQGYSFYHSFFIKGKPRKGYTNTYTPRLGLNIK